MAADTSVSFSLLRSAGLLRDAFGRRFDPSSRQWRPAGESGDMTSAGGSAGISTRPETADTAAAGESGGISARSETADIAAAGESDGISDASAARKNPGVLATGAGAQIDAIAAAAWVQRHSGHPVRAPIGVIGPREASPAQRDAAQAVGSGLASMGLATLCGGRQGVMEAACKGAASAGGVAIGLLPETDPDLANPYVTVAIATGIGEARNALIARAALCLVAIGDSYGTLSEVALSRHFGKRVVGLAGAARVEGVEHVDTPQEALEIVAQCVLAWRAP